MDLRSYMRFLRSNWEMLAACTLIGMIAALGLTLCVTPRFAATSQFFLTTPGYSNVGSLSANNRSPYQADLFSQQRARSYVELATRVDLARRVVDKLGLSIRPEDLARATTASVEPDTVLMSVTVESTSPTEARTLANAMTDELVEDIRKLETPSGTLIPTVDPVVIQRAEIPTKPNEPKTAILVIVGGSSGFLIGLSFAYWRRRKRSATRLDVEEITGRPILGSVGFDAVDIADKLSADGTSQPWPSVQHNLEIVLGDAIHRTLALASVPADEDNSQIAVDLGSALAGMGRQVVLVMNRPIAEAFAPDPNYTQYGFAAVLAGEAQVDEAVAPSTQSANLSFLAGPGPDRISPLVSSEKFRQLVDRLHESFDTVVLDFPNFVEHAESTSLSEEVVDSVILVIREDATDREAVTAVTRTIGRSGAEILGSIIKSGSGGGFSAATQLTSVKLGRSRGT